MDYSKGRIFLQEVSVEEYMQLVIALRQGCIAKHEYTCEDGHRHSDTVVATHPEKCAISVWCQ